MPMLDISQLESSPRVSVLTTSLLVNVYHIDYISTASRRKGAGNMHLCDA